WDGDMGWCKRCRTVTGGYCPTSFAENTLSEVAGFVQPQFRDGAKPRQAAAKPAPSRARYGNRSLRPSAGARARVGERLGEELVEVAPSGGVLGGQMPSPAEGAHGLSGHGHGNHRSPAAGGPSVAAGELGDLADLGAADVRHPT